jgi:hypothetical protein
MQYLLLLYRDEKWLDSLSEEERAAITREYTALHEEAIASGDLVAAAPLRFTDTATTVRVREEELVVTDGPFAETKEQLGGFFLVDVDTVDEARAWAARIPAARHGSVEVRPIVPVPVEVTAG